MVGGRREGSSRGGPASDTGIPQLSQNEDPAEISAPQLAQDVLIAGRAPHPKYRDTLSRPIEAFGKRSSVWSGNEGGKKHPRGLALLGKNGYVKYARV